jgi:Protein of unknown function (DUF1207)
MFHYATIVARQPMRLKHPPLYIALLIIMMLPCQATAEENQHPVLNLLPSDNLFPPLLADPHSPLPSLKYFSTTNHESFLAKIAAGAVFGLIQLDIPHAAVQLKLEGGIFSRFDLNTRLLAETVDYRIGFSLDIAAPNSSDGLGLQISPYHTSSHLVDNGIFRNYSTDPNVYQASPPVQIIPPNRYARDAVRLLAAYRFSSLNRLYAGMAYSYDGVNERSLIYYQAGSELFSPALLLLGREFRLYLAEDLQVKQETDWNLNINAQAGLSIRSTEARHGLRIAVEYFAGNAVEGQFFEQKEQNIGVAAIFEL